MMKRPEGGYLIPWQNPRRCTGRRAGPRPGPAAVEGMGQCEREEMPAGGRKGRQRGNEETCQLISSFKQINNGSEILAPSERPELSFRNQNYFTIHGPAVDIGCTPALRYGYENLEIIAGSQHAIAKTPLPNLAAVAMPSGGRAIEVRQFPSSSSSSSSSGSCQRSQDFSPLPPGQLLFFSCVRRVRGTTRPSLEKASILLAPGER